MEEIIKQGVDKHIVEEIIRKIDKAEYKRKQAPPILKITTRAFGIGRRMPIAWKRGW